MIETARSSRGMVSAPHHLAAEAGLRVLREGGNAIEAMVAAAATITVVYPHMNALGGDNFWLIHEAGEVTGIDACGAASMAANRALYTDLKHRMIPTRGPLAALTVAGAPSGWELALQISANRGGFMPLSRLMEDAIYYAENGIPVSCSLNKNIVAKADELQAVPGFSEIFLPAGEPPLVGDRLVFSALAETLRRLGSQGIDDFYNGDLATSMASDLKNLGSPIGRDDLARHRARIVAPLSVATSAGTLYNMPPPTQGLASLLILALFDRLERPKAESAEYVHLLLEATKAAFRVRDSHICDPDYMTVSAEDFTSNSALSQMASDIDREIATPWPSPMRGGDTVWLGAADSEGCVVSFIQSIYWEFGSGIVLPDTGIVWQNRGIGFSLDEGHHNRLEPMRRPFHTIQPALARLPDGEVMAYGTMGGEGQPQTQAALFSRYAIYGQELQQSVNAPRWLLGKTWGDDTTALRIEDRFESTVIDELERRGHSPELTDAFDDIMGHAGAVVARRDGMFEGASDPRSDGAACGF